ncbi:MAG: universal stress protein [Planctomycetia bacterium]|nr:universal stress protein [Planctomycetia bacterium]
MLETAVRRVREYGAEDISTLHWHGDLVETLMDIEKETRLLVVGCRGAGRDTAAHAMGSHLESVIRTIHKPILIVLAEFSPPNSFMIAFDGSPTAQKALAMVVGNPLLKGLPCHLVMCNGSDEQKAQLPAAFDELVSAGFDVIQKMLEGKVQAALDTYQKQNQIELMVMGAYGHSRVRQFLVGSNTTCLLCTSNIPLLLLR